MMSRQCILAGKLSVYKEAVSRKSYKMTCVPTEAQFDQSL